MPLDFTAKFPRPSIWLVAGVFAMHSSAQVGEVLKVEFDDFSRSRTLEWNDMAEDQWGSIYVAVDRDIVYSRGGQWMPMPEMDGIEATKTIRRELPTQRQPHIIALTAGATADDREDCIKAGMDQFITKPVRITELYDAFAKAKTQYQDKPS